MDMSLVVNDKPIYNGYTTSRNLNSEDLKDEERSAKAVADDHFNQAGKTFDSRVVNRF